MLLAERAGRKLERRSNSAPRGMAVIALACKSWRRNKIRPIGLLHLNSPDGAAWRRSALGAQYITFAIYFLTESSQISHSIWRPPRPSVLSFICIKTILFFHVVYTTCPLVICLVAQIKLLPAFLQPCPASRKTRKIAIFSPICCFLSMCERKFAGPIHVVGQRRLYCIKSTNCIYFNVFIQRFSPLFGTQTHVHR